MKRLTISAVAFVGICAAIAAGYELGRRDAIHLAGFWRPVVATDAAPIRAANASPVERIILYYRDAMGKADYSPVPKKDSMGMDSIPVYEDEQASETPPAAPAAAHDQPAAPANAKSRILYYRNPMGLPDTSPAPKKDPMGMDYVPVYEGDEPDDAGSVKIGLAKVQRLGVRTEPAALRSLARTIRATGTVQADERSLSVVSTKFEGWIEKLHVNATGQAVRKGEALMEVYAPELVAAQQEYLLARQALVEIGATGTDARAGASGLVEASLRKLRNWDLSEDQIGRLRRDGTASRLMTLRAPAAGIVLEKAAVAGMRFMPGEALYRLADLSTVWLVAEVFEQDLGSVRQGQTVRTTVAAYPGEAFAGTVAFIYPTLSRETRTGKIRVDVPNRDARLKTDMYATLEVAVPLGQGPVLAVPDSAVLDSGTRQAVLVDRGEGRFEPREVKLGARADGYTEIRGGLASGESVVVGANFLIDAESNIKAALRGFAEPAPQGAAR